ncbi:YybH family protein [Henriciella litoralis]|uniref:YybH family protein n=1 Tax=Henriciella litoralis TaxID=568102 RepID=UPI000A055FCD|nr:nuclear transport factor 2 family protein [Henriciella litoralis]
MRLILTCIALSALPLLPACQSTSTMQVADIDDAATATQIKQVVMQQSEAWNEGDIVAFMDGYWRSENLRFASGGTVTRGFDQTLARYQQRYSDRSAMGTLTFDQLELVTLSPDAAVLHGRWMLTRADDAPSGLFTLIFRKFDTGWKIVSDTTTSAD